MAWVRYDDQFYCHPKVTAVIAEDAGAIALHTLANTWTNGQKRMGFIPAHQPGILVCDKSQGAEWAALLVKHDLWHRTDSMCPACKEEYADLPSDLVGYVIHNAKEYRAPERDRTTPGTSAELSEKRREAGRKGGKATAKKREQVQQGARANEDDDASNDGKLPFAGVSKTSNLPPAGVSPVPVPVVASNEATEERPHPSDVGAGKPHTADDPPKKPGRRAKPRQPSFNAGDVIAAYVEGAAAAGQPRPGESLRARVGKQANALLSEGNSLETLIDAARSMGAKGWNDLAVQLQRDAAEAAKRTTAARSTTDDRVAQAQALKAELRAAEPPPHPEYPPPLKVIPGDVA